MIASKIRRGAAALALVLAAASAGGQAQAETRVTLKSAASTSSYYVMMVQLGELLRESSNGEIQATVEESQGSVQNVKEAARRPGNFVFTTPPSLLASARAGKAPFEGESGYDRVRTLFVMPFITVQLVVGADSGITDVTQLAGKTFIPGGTGTFCERRTQTILKLLGVADKVEMADVELNNAAAAMRNDRVAGFATCSSHPTPTLVELATTMPVHILSFTEAQRDKLIAEDPQSGPITIAPGTYKGQDAPVQTVGVPVGAFTTTDMDDDTAYTIVKTFWEQKKSLEKESPWWAGVTPDLIAQMGTKLHPGAARYYKEAGVAVPEALLP